MSERSPPATAAAALVKVPKPGGMVRAMSRAFVYYRVASRAADAPAPIDYRGGSRKPEGNISGSEVLLKVSELGFRFVGVYEYLGLFGWTPRETWVTEDGDVRLSARREKATGVEGMMSSYFLGTTFDDGTVVVTFARSPAPIASGERATCLGGTGNLTKDLTTHREAVARRMAETPGLRIIPASTVDDCIALSAHHDRFATTDAEVSNIIKVRVYGWGGMAAVVAAIIWVLMRLLGH